MTLEGQVDTGRTTHLPQMHRQVPWKTWVRVATTANGTLASAFDNGSSVDGVTLATGDRILLKNQTATEENGIYVVQASGVPFRAFDMDDIEEVQGAVVLVLAGTANAGTLWYTTSTPAVLDDDAIVFAQFTGGGADLSGINFLVGTATGLLSAEIVAGTTPGGELGGTWASPTVDGTHSGSAHTDFIAKSLLTTQDDIIVRDGTGPARLAKGTDGQVLTVDPTTHHLVWATPTAGGISGIGVKEGGSTVVASATALDFGNGLDVASPGGGVASVVVDPSEIKLDDLGTPDDNTDLNASTSAHGLLRKLPNDATLFLNGVGGFADPGVPPATGSAFNEAIYGSGADGDVTISVTTTITRDMFYNNLTVDPGVFLHTALLKIFVKGTLTLNGTIDCNGNNGGNGGTGTAAAGGAAGAAGAQQTGGAVQSLPNGAAGRAGAVGGFNSNGNAGTNASQTTFGGTNVPAGTSGGISGSGRSGGAGGSGTTDSNNETAKPYYWSRIIEWKDPGGSNYNFNTVVGQAAGAGSGGGAAASGGGGGGGSGSSGGPCVVVARIITGAGSIRSVGGNGGNGGNGLAGAQAGGGAAGNGGQGGVVVLIYSDKSGWSGSLDASGGTKGTAGNAGGGAGSTNGGAGNDGNAGKTFQYRIS